MPGTDVGERQPADAALGAAHTLHRRHGLDGCDELNRRFRRSAIAGQFIDRMGSHGGFIVVTALALTSLAIALFGFKQIKDSTEQPMLTTVNV